MPLPSENLAKKWLKRLIVVELLGVFGAYGVYYKMNTSQEFRSTMNRRFPSILEAYYKSNEYAGVFGIRERDHETWAAKNN